MHCSCGRTEGPSALRKEITPTSSFPGIGRLHLDQSRFVRHYSNFFPRRIVNRNGYVGTAALGCPVEQSSIWLRRSAAKPAQHLASRIR